MSNQCLHGCEADKRRLHLHDVDVARLQAEMNIRQADQRAHHGAYDDAKQQCPVTASEPVRGPPSGDAHRCLAGVALSRWPQVSDRLSEVALDWPFVLAVG